MCVKAVLETREGKFRSTTIASRGWVCDSPLSTEDIFRRYEGWQVASVSQTPDLLKVMVANPTMIDAYKSGIPGNDHQRMGIRSI